MKTITKEINAFTLTIGKILEESLIYISMRRSNVTIGVHEISWITIKMVAPMNTLVCKAMAGKSKNIIQRTINWTLANMENSVSSLIVHTITGSQISVSPSSSGLRSSPKLGLWHSLRTIICPIWGTWLLIKTLWDVSSKLAFRRPRMTPPSKTLSKISRVLLLLLL